MLAGRIITVLGMAALPLTESLPVGTRSPWPIVSQAVLTAGWSLLNINLVPTLIPATTQRGRNSAFSLKGALRGLGTFLGTISGACCRACLPICYINRWMIPRSMAAHFGQARLLVYGDSFH
jgi:hypothetical protein